MDNLFATPRRTLILSTLLLGLAVILGAFGAHGLEKSLGEKALNTYQTGITYHYYHAFALGFVALWEKAFYAKSSAPKFFFLIGILLFSGNCYLYALTSLKAFALVVPLGGVAFILGWLSFSYAVYRHN